MYWPSLLESDISMSRLRPSSESGRPRTSGLVDLRCGEASLSKTSSSNSLDNWAFKKVPRPRLAGSEEKRANAAWPKFPNGSGYCYPLVALLGDFSKLSSPSPSTELSRLESIPKAPPLCCGRLITYLIIITRNTQLPERASN